MRSTARHPGRLRFYLRAERGQSLITMALMMTVLIAFLAIVIESGLVYVQRRNLQNAADAAALAGAQELNGTLVKQVPAEDAARDWAAKNVTELKSVEADGSIDGYTKIRVTVRKDAPTAFAGWLSFGSPEIRATAAARIASVNSLVPCVVPLGVQATIYTAAYADPDLLVGLKLAVNGGPDGTSNTGLLSLMSGNSATPMAEGACNVLGPTVDSKPGGTIGDVNNGLRDRLAAAIVAGCYTEADARTKPACLPDLLSSDGLQATAVLLLPVLAVDIVESGAHTYSLAKDEDGRYLLAYFWVDGNSTYVDPLAGKWGCIDNSGDEKCTIWGKFMFNLPVALSVFDTLICPPPGDSCLIDYDPNALVRIVQLVE